MAFTYRVTGLTNVVAFRRDLGSAETLPITTDVDISPGEEIQVHNTPGQTGGSLNLVKREGGSNSSAVAIKPTNPRWISISALYAEVVDTTKTEAIYEKAYS
jgi:hypothetical protein